MAAPNTPKGAVIHYTVYLNKVGGTVIRSGAVGVPSGELQYLYLEETNVTIVITAYTTYQSTTSATTTVTVTH
jgi:hypothetical protein